MLSIYVDFHNTTPTGKIRLNTIGSIRDLNRSGIQLKDGLAVHLYSEELEVPGSVEFAPDERIWVADFNWDDVKSIKS